MTTEFWMGLSLGVGCLVIACSWGCLQCGTFWGFPGHRSSATYLSSDWIGEHERNKQAGAGYLGNMGFSAKTSRVV